MPPMNRKHRQIPSFKSAGFTLIELLVTISVVALVLAIATPSFTQMMVRNRVSSYTNELIGTINFARSEAMRRSAPVSICASDDGLSCGGTWSDGWIVFVNNNADSPAVVDAGETVLKSYENGGLTTGYTLNSDTFSSDISFRRDGSATATGLFAICHDNSTKNARALAITPLRPRVATDTDGDGIPNRDDTKNISSCAAPGGT